jgi:hypothetical protein
VRKQQLAIAVGATALALPLLGGVGGTAQAGPTTAKPTDARQAAFAQAAREAGVPENVLLAVSYNESRWDAHGMTPSTSGAYGPMALTDASPEDDKGDGVTHDSPALHTAATAAHLIGADTRAVTSDETTNIRAAAALLASYARAANHGQLPGSVGGWYAAVARYSGSGSAPAAREFADGVYATITKGAKATTTDGHTLALAADPGVKPDTAGLAALHLAQPADTAFKPECPRGLDCDYVPAAYQLNNPADKGDYGNYDLGNRPVDEKINFIVVHDTEEYYTDTLAIFENPLRYASAHYVVRSADGHVTQMIPTKDVAWQAGNWYINSHSVGIEQEGFATLGATWYTESLYHSTAKLVKYLAAKYDVPLDRSHIIGHENVPGTTSSGIKGMHWDPGPYWDWSHFFTLLGHPFLPTGTPWSGVVTLNPRWATNKQFTRDCEKNIDLPVQSASFVYLRQAPSDDAPLVNDPGLNGTAVTEGTQCAADWGDKVTAGQQYVVAGRHGQWTAIWWGGQKAWFKDDHLTLPASGWVVTPKPGITNLAIYGRAYPEAAAYAGTQIPVQSVLPYAQYNVTPDQSYVSYGSLPSQYYYAPTIDASLPNDHTVVTGQDRYVEIQFGHRVAFVKASDVDVHFRF